MTLLSLFFIPDRLSWWFIAIITVVFSAGAVYGIDYLKTYKERRKELVMHVFWYVLTFASMILLTMTENAVAFLVMWELMALGSFFLIIFESWNSEVVKAGMNFFIQSHVSVVFLTIGFLMMYAKTGSLMWSDWAAFEGPCGLPFAFVCVGFAIKAGFFPFHTWLPVAHPAAPAHISGVMSGVIIKIGIYGLLRSVLVFHVDMLVAGKIILAVAAVSGLYGVMMAIIQHNLKRLLAYHSIENIGIIGMGIGLGCIARALGMPAIASLAFGGALLHTMNHALFKSTLFFVAGNVYQATHTLNIEHLGGLLKKLPLTGLFFLVSAVAICGLPPLNGFVSEIMIYLGLFDYLGQASPLSRVGVVGAILALVLIGGFAILCFTKAFGIVFLGEERHPLPEHKEFGLLRTVPLATLSLAMLSVGVWPEFYVGQVNGIMPLFGCPAVALHGAVAGIGRMSAVVIALTAFLWLLRHWVTKGREAELGPTWGCGYTVASPKMQYTATSFVKTYSRLFGSMLKSGLIERSARAYVRLTGKFAFLQNGHLQSYILYGIVFIVTTIILTLVLC